MSTNDDTTKRYLEDAVTEAWSQPQVEAIGVDTYAVTVPGHRYQHDTLTLVLRGSRRDEGERPWLISDDGYTAFLLGDRYEQLADLLQDSPLIDGRVSESAITLRSADESIGDAIVSFARELTGLLVAANTLEAYVAARKSVTAATSSSKVMAREVKAQLERAVPRLSGLYRIDRQLRYAHVTVRAPLAVNGRSGDAGAPAVVASTVDLSSSMAARFALGTTSLVLDVAEQLHVARRFVVVRGEPDRAEELVGLYDRKDTTVLSSTDLEALIATAAELEQELLDA